MLWLTLTVFCFVFQVNSSPVENPTLHLLHVFFRHGDRTPDKKDFYPTDPYANYSFYPYRLGQLTNSGKNREYQLGQLLRTRYGNFLGDIYTPDMVYARSSDFDRTKMSLQLVFAGLFPPKDEQVWNKNLMWQPIPYQYMSPAQDFLIQRPNSYCPRYLQELQAIFASKDVQDYVLDNKELFHYTETWTGRPMVQPINMFDVYQNLKAEDTLKLTLPEWTKQIYPDPLHSVAAMELKFENYNDILIRLNGGHSLKFVLDNTNRKIHQNEEMKEKKIILISGHENNVVNVLTTLEQFIPHVPNYGSAVILELHRINNIPEEYAFRIFYHDQNTDEPKMLQLKGCDELCPLEKFIDLTKKYVPENYTAECNSDINLD